MKESPVITKVEAIHVKYSLENLGKDYNTFNMVYEAGSKLKQACDYLGNLAGGIMEETWRRNHGGGIMDEESWRRNHGG